MIYNENGIIINNGYQLDILINEGFSDIANKGLKTVHGWIRKLIDAVQNAIEYASRIKYNKIIDNIKRMDDGEFGVYIKSMMFIYPYIESEGYGKWIENFNNALNELKRDNTLSTEDINKILYEDKNKNEWFKNGLKNYNASGKKPDFNKMKTIVINLQDFTKPLRKSYSELKILNTNINKGMKINSDVMKEMHSYCINAISAYRNMSKILIDNFEKNNKQKVNIQEYINYMSDPDKSVGDIRISIVRDIMDLKLNKNDIRILAQEPKINIHKVPFNNKKPKNNWNEEYLKLLSKEIIGGTWSEEYLLHLYDVAEFVKKYPKGQKNIKSKNNTDDNQNTKSTGNYRDERSKKYGITQSFYDAVESSNIRRVRIMMKNSLLVDLTFEQFHEMERIAKNMEDLYDKHDGGKEFITDKSQWNDNYMNKLMVKVVNNFSHERLNHLMDVVKYLRVDNSNSDNKNYEEGYIKFKGKKIRKFDIIENAIKEKNIGSLRRSLGNIIMADRNFSDNTFYDTLEYVNSKINIMEPNLNGELVSAGKSTYTDNDFNNAVFELTENFCKERIEDVKKIGRYLYPLEK